MKLGRGIFQEIKAGELGGSSGYNKPLVSCQAFGKLPEVYNTVNFKWHPEVKSQKYRKKLNIVEEEIYCQLSKFFSSNHTI